MDIVTHGMMGLAIAAPFLATEPGAAVGFILGSTLPDLDAFSRCFGRRAFLRWHQGWTHSVPVQLLTGGLVWGVSRWIAPEFSTLVLGLLAGATVHSLLDLTNTYGIRISAPFSRQRFCFEWMFFIDSGVLLLTALALVPALGSLIGGKEADTNAAVLYAIALVVYTCLKAGLRRRARRLASDNAVSVIPSAMWPWMFLVCERSGGFVVTSKLNALTGRSMEMSRHFIHDDEFIELLSKTPEFRTMSELSPAYHVIDRREADGDIYIRCRDMRIVNFDTSFGMLDVTFNREQQATAVELHV